MTVLGRRIEDIDEFIEKLEATGAFHDVLPTQEDTTDEGLHRLMVRSVYTGTASEAPAGRTADADAEPRVRRSPSPRSPNQRSLLPARAPPAASPAGSSAGTTPAPPHLAVAPDAEAGR